MVGYFQLFKIILLLMLPLDALVRILMLFTDMALAGPLPVPPTEVDFT